MEPVAPEPTGPSPEPPAEPAVQAVLATVTAEQWSRLWAAADAAAGESTPATWAGGQTITITGADGGQRPVMQMPYPVYSDAMERLLGVIGELGLVVPFEWMQWDGVERYRGGAGMAAAPVGDAVRMITAVVRSERFCDGSIEGAWQDGTLPAALARLRARYGPGS